MNELQAVFKILVSIRQQAREPLALLTHLSRPLGSTVGSTAKRPDHIILHAGAGKNMRTQHVDAAASQRRRALPYYSISLHFMNRVRQTVRAQGKVLAHRFRQVRTVHRNTAGDNELSYDGVVTIGFADGLHDSGSTGYVNLPHTVEIKHAGADWIKHKGQVNQGDRAGFPQQEEQLTAGCLQTKVHPYEPHGMAGLGRIKIDSNDLVIR